MISYMPRSLPRRAWEVANGDGLLALILVLDLLDRLKREAVTW